MARAIEMDGMATTLTSWHGGVTRLTKPPRAAFTRLKRGATLGEPGDREQQLRVLCATLNLLGQNAPLEPVMLDERPLGD